MQKGYGNYFRWIGRIEKAFLAFCVIAAALYLFGAPFNLQFFFIASAFILGITALIRAVGRVLRGAIWRLRNRLIVTYVFIAVIPILLIVALTATAGYLIIGQIAVYLVNTELNHREESLLGAVQALVRTPRPGQGAGRGPVPPPGGPARITVERFQGPRSGRRGVAPGVVGSGAPQGLAGRGAVPGVLPATASDSDRMLGFFMRMTRGSFPGVELLVTGEKEERSPPDSKLTRPAESWDLANGLIVRNDGQHDRLYAWAHAENEGREVTAAAPITYEQLANLVPTIGPVDIHGESPTFIPVSGNATVLEPPPSKGLFDFRVNGFYEMNAPSWDDPENERAVTLVVYSRLSAVLGAIFQEREWAQTMMDAIIAMAVLFLLLETVSLFAGVRLSRTITGAVHELYEGTQRVKEGDFSYRIPVKGNDQLAELGASFNTMTENLGRLIVVSKEKERLESELAIAREVQNQLFPKDAPASRCLELKGVCNPARMVSGDYYDFIKLSDHALAFAIGDVAGKGISAALLMATIQSTMRTQLSAMTNGNAAHLSTARMVANLNRQLFATTAPEKYATFYFAVHEETTGTLTYTNAGHLAPMLLRNGSVQTLDSTGTVVGAFAIARYQEKKIVLQPGDLLVCYTDGIVEPENAYGEMFGDDRLKELLLKHSCSESSEIIARVMEAVNQWTGAGELQDDMTMVVARRL